jgi:phospholipid-translocating ATPase
VFEYTYLLFWNVFWTLCPVIAIGVFDRFMGMCSWFTVGRIVYFLHIDADILMAVPELYRYGREGSWYGLRLFCIYMLDGIYQVCLFLQHQSMFS